MTWSNFPLPKTGAPIEDIEHGLDELAGDDVRYHWMRCFRAGADVQEIGRRAYNRFLADNGVFAMHEASMVRVERELIGMCLSLFNPPEGAAGTITSGGTESIYNALHAMREWARAHHKNVRKPEVLATASTHGAFSKGCHYFGLKLVRTPLGGDLRGSADALAAAVTPNTIGIVGSAPSWPYGLYDPIEAFSDIAERHNLWLHVDACVGGYLAPFVERLGHTLPVWDFRAPRVQSISADLHKLGYCPKGISTVLWRSESHLKHHYVHPADWIGGDYRTVGMSGSRTMGPVYAAWTIMRYLGEQGYCDLASKLLGAKAALREGINGIDGLFVRENDLLPMTFGASAFDLQKVAAGLKGRGWLMLSCPNPPLFTLPVDPATDKTVIDTFLTDLSEVCAGIRRGELTERAALRYQ